MRHFFQIFLAIALLASSAGCSMRRQLDLTKSQTQLEVGVSAAKDDLWREALFRFQRAVQIDPANAMAQNNLAVAYEGIGEFEKARQAYSEALKLDRSNEYIQKNYSRFVEFYSRNRKREQRRQDPREEPVTTAATTTTTAPAAAEPSADDDDGEEDPAGGSVIPTVGTPPSEPTPIPATNPEPPTTPVTSPPDTNKPDSPPKGAFQ